MKTKTLIIPIQIRYADIDIAGHVNNAVYLSYFEFGRVRMMQEVLGRKDFDPAYVLARAEINYLKRLRFGDSPVCETWVDRIGNTSITFTGRVVLDGEDVANSRVVVVKVDKKMKPDRISDEERQLFGRYLNGEE